MLQSASDITFSCFLVYLCTLRFADDELSTVQYWDVCPPAKWHSLRLRARLNIHSERLFFLLNLHFDDTVCPFTCDKEK